MADEIRDDPERALEAEIDRFEEHVEQLGERVEHTRKDWERKREDPNVPGAPQPPRDRDTPAAGAPTGGAGKRAEED